MARLAMTDGHQAKSPADEPRLDPPGLSAEDLQCPICMSRLQDPFVTTCGHTFCYGCISQHLQGRSNCPGCRGYLTRDHIFPNFLLSKVTDPLAAQVLLR